MAAPGSHRRRRLNLSPQEIERRTAQILPHSRQGAAASAILSRQNPEQRALYSRMGAAARTANYRRMKAAMTPDTLPGIRASRMALEAEAAQFRKRLARRPDGGEGMDPAVAAVILRDYRAEIAELSRRERVLLKDGPETDGAPVPRAGESAQFQEDWGMSDALRPLDPSTAVAD